MRLTRIHYAWVVVAITFLALLVSSSVRAAPGVLITPLEREYGWDRAAISAAIAVSILTFGLGGPVSGTLVSRFGPRKIILFGCSLVAAGLLAMLTLHQIWQLFVYWGVIVGVGTGAVGSVLGATVAHRWFRSHRGLVIGAFGAATSTGQLIFIPAMASLTVGIGWRAAIQLLIAACVLVLVPVAVLMRDKPEDVGVRAFGEQLVLSDADRADDARGTPMRVAVRTGDFWLLAGSFFICGYTSNGLIGTHLIPHAIDHGFTEVTAAGAVGLMGAMNIVGTLGSGWLSDRYDNRKLLAAYYAFRALSLSLLPLIFDVQGLYLFAFVYGLDWIATVPPTANLVARIYGRASLGTIYGWVYFSHMTGAAIAAYAAGYVHTILGNYHLMFISAALFGVVAAGLALRIQAPARAATAAAAA
ncbi:MAG TPA: MFS transporter [Candidatus Limnocylindria bacterium]|nr:MFS transporter [Candidatus Limnocylindria bacterium]